MTRSQGVVAVVAALGLAGCGASDGSAPKTPAGRFEVYATADGAMTSVPPGKSPRDVKAVTWKTTIDVRTDGSYRYAWRNLYSPERTGSEEGTWRASKHGSAQADTRAWILTPKGEPPTPDWDPNSQPPFRWRVLWSRQDGWTLPSVDFERGRVSPDAYWYVGPGRS